MAVYIVLVFVSGHAIAEIVTNLKTFSNIIYRVAYACWMRNSRRQLAVY